MNPFIGLQHDNRHCVRVSTNHSITYPARLNINLVQLIMTRTVEQLTFLK